MSDIIWVQTREGVLWGISSNILYRIKNMSSRSNTSNKVGEESSFMLQAMQQQFECMNVVFNEIWDQIDRQDAVIAILHEEHP